jgi:hypothetical protein
MSVRQFVPFAFVSTIFFLLLCASFSALGRWSLLFVLGLYLFAALTAAFLSARRIEIAALPAVFLSFVILHFSYGLGFFAGLIKFRRRWHNDSAANGLTTKPLH